MGKHSKTTNRDKIQFKTVLRLSNARPSIKMEDDKDKEGRSDYVQFEQESPTSDLDVGELKSNPPPGRYELIIDKHTDKRNSLPISITTKNYASGIDTQ